MYQTLSIRRRSMTHRRPSRVNAAAYYVPFHDTPPLDRGPVWRAGDASARIHSFVATAREIVAHLDGPAGPAQ
ncbi:MAG TPA: hypothetical protein VK891_17225 [Euzebyales bacterium]|nr:hypothetical protein [Euzebyales bacterium]